MISTLAQFDTETLTKSAEFLAAKSDRYLFLLVLVILCTFSWYIMRRSFRQNDSLSDKLQEVTRESLIVHQRVSNALEKVVDRLDSQGEDIRALRAKNQ
jgi:hypothetical protein